MQLQEKEKHKEMEAMNHECRGNNLTKRKSWRRGMLL
jgi:hypothetical protein